MSSHHFVKEGQEPPLVVLDWSSKLAKITMELLGWQPLFVVEQSVLDRVLAYGLKPDVILQPKKGLKYDQLVPISFWQKLPSKPLTIITLSDKKACVNFVLQANYVVYSEHYKYFKIDNCCFKLWLTKGTILEVFDVENDGFENYEVQTDGLFSKTFDSNQFVVIQKL